MTPHALALTPYVLAVAAERAYHDTPTFSIAGVEICVTHHGAEVLFSFRGTTFDSWDIVADIYFLPWYAWGVGWVHRGFWRGVKEVWPYIEAYIKADGIDPARCHYTGHSKGGAEATDAAVLHKKRWGVIGSLSSFGKPRCGRSLETYFDPGELRRFVIAGDPVPQVPLALIFFRHEFDSRQIGDPDHNPAVLEPELHKALLYVERSKGITW